VFGTLGPVHGFALDEDRSLHVVAGRIHIPRIIRKKIWLFSAK
jgi:hypothetical protein